MEVATLDLIFPWIVLAYGGLTTLVLSFPPLVALAEEKFSAEVAARFLGHRWLGVICLVGGGFWCLQNIWVGELGF
jgi:hypothetical protein